MRAAISAAWIAILIACLGAPQAAYATDRDLKAVINTSAYGMLAGTGIGLIAWPIARSDRAIFLGTSLGLYLGIAVGIYYITHRDEPGNPLRVEQDGIPGGPARAAFEPGHRTDEPRLAFQYPVYRF